MFKHILLATDGSPASEHAAALAIALACKQEARLTAIYVVDPYPYLGLGVANPYGFEAYMQEAQAHAREAHAGVEALCQQMTPPLAVKTLMVEDAAVVKGIVQAAKDEAADLIVIGSHGRSGLARLVLGGVASKVVAESPVPVLVTR